MNLFIKLFRVIFLTIIILPIWVSICLVGFFISVILHIFFTSKLDDDLKYRNNIQNIFDEFKIQLFSIFCYL
jgi:hypothetical protein